MNFREKLSKYIEKLSCSAKELSEASGLSAATLSRYRSGERLPEVNTSAYESLCAGIAFIAQNKHIEDITKDSVSEDFLNCSDIITVDKEKLRQNFNTLISVLDINIAKLCHHTNYESSTIFRFRNGSRQPAEPAKFAAAVAGYVAGDMSSATEKAILAELLGCTDDELADLSVRCEKIKGWLLEGQAEHDNGLSDFLTKMDEFDLNEFIKAIHFDEMKVPSVPFRLPTSKTYFGLKEMMESELDFLKATVLSKSMEPVIMYSDMPMRKMGKDLYFPKKWMFGMAMMLKKGLHLNQIHNLDRSFDDMMLGLESWIPMYMTGQITPYYLKNVQNNVFLHLLKVSGAAALSGEAITDHHSDGKYYLTKSKNEVAYCRKRAEALLESAQPLMNIYRKENSQALTAFLASNSHTEGKRRNILSSLPLYTMDKEYLEQFLKRRKLSAADRENILAFADNQRQMTEELLGKNDIEDEISLFTEDEFERYPMVMSLSGMFYESDIPYTWEEYQDHLEQTRQYAAEHSGYTLTETNAHAFRNLQIIIHEGKWAMISKNKSPTIHFVIHHPKLRRAIESFIPPVIES